MIDYMTEEQYYKRQMIRTSFCALPYAFLLAIVLVPRLKEVA